MIDRRRWLQLAVSATAAGSLLGAIPAAFAAGMAVALLAKAGFTVLASTGRRNEEAYLRDLGASEVIGREELSGTLRCHRQQLRNGGCLEPWIGDQ